MNQSFYNTTTKSKFVMDKFNNDKYLSERSSPVFQNMLKRTIDAPDVWKKVASKERKFLAGY